MKKVFIIPIILVILTVKSYCQFEDKYWIVGYLIGEGTHPLHGYNLINFERDNVVKIDTGHFQVDNRAYNSSISSETGIITYTNGCRVIDGITHETVENGESINGPSHLYPFYCEGEKDALFGWQLSVFLQNPQDNKKLGLFHMNRMITQDVMAEPDAFLYTEIEEGEEGLKVNIKNQLIASQVEENVNFSYGLTATRHGNGRDWWIIVPISRGESPRLLVYLWDGEDITLWDEYFINNNGRTSITIFDQVSFNSKGNRLSAINAYDVNRIYLFDFDRCNGYFGADSYIEIERTYSGGVTFSHSGRYLYHADKLNLVDTTSDIWQYDLEAEDIAASRQVVINFDYTLATDYWESRTGVWHLTRAPDGKIYVGSTTTTTHYHVINYPELEGEAADFEYYGLRVPKIRNFGIPLFPNYHVTAMPGTPCDTLDMGKAPYAKWNYQVRGDTVRFFDLTYYTPTEWSWDFGDGQTGEEAMPVHVYAEKGIYEVCLTASSAYGSDEFCMEVESGTTSVEEEISGIRKLEIYPNPVQEEVYISTELVGSRYEIVSISGQRVGIGVLESERLDVRGLQGGVYMIRVWVGGEVYVGKVVKI